MDLFKIMSGDGAFMMAARRDLLGRAPAPELSTAGAIVVGLVSAGIALTYHPALLMVPGPVAHERWTRGPGPGRRHTRLG